MKAFAMCGGADVRGTGPEPYAQHYMMEFFMDAIPMDRL